MSGRISTVHRALTLALGLVAVGSPSAAQLLDEGFESVAALDGLGWKRINHSDPQPVDDYRWFQGLSDDFPAYEGSPGSFLMANYLSVLSIGTISNWALTPVVPLVAGDVLVFRTRTEVLPALFPDRLEVRLSLSGASSDIGSTADDVGDFDRLLLTVNPELATDVYPMEWTEFVATVPELPHTGAMGRFAFRYFVTDGGPTGVNSNEIGVDSVHFDSPGVFFDGFESADSTAWSDTTLPLLAAGEKSLSNQNSFDFVSGAVGTISGGDLYVRLNQVDCDGGPAAWGDQSGQGSGRFLSDLAAPLSSFAAPETGYTTGRVCLEVGSVYVYQLQSPAGAYAYFRVVESGFTQVTLDYEVR